MRSPRVVCASLLLVAALATGAAAAREVAGVTFPESIRVDQTTLHLNGAGVRKKAVFKVYAVGLYLEQPTQDARQVIGSDQMKRVEMVMLRDLGREQVIDAVRTGFERNAGARMPALRERLDAFTAAIPPLEEGQTFAVTYMPGRGTLLQAPGRSMLIPGKDFADALFSVWLGASPIDAELRGELLGAR